MAEVVGMAFGVVSLGVQLAESVQKVKRFYNDVKDAPERLADVIDEIESLSDILIDLESTKSSDGTGVGPNVQRCVAACRKAVERFSTYANGLENRLKRSKRRGSVKVALKSESIEEVISRLESSKSNLVLAYMLFREAVSDKRAEFVQNQLHTVMNGQAMLLQRASSVHDTQLAPRDTVKRRPQPKGHVGLHLKTPRWVSQTIHEIVVNRAISGWTASLRSYTVVPVKSPVCMACMNGDVETLRQLFQRGDASPFDEISFGGFSGSLIVQAIFAQQTQVARLLAAHGSVDIRDPPSVLSAFYNPFTRTYNNVDDFRGRYRFLVDDSEYEPTPGQELCTDSDQHVRLHVFLFGTTKGAKYAAFWSNVHDLFWTGDPSGLLEAVAIDGDVMYLLEEFWNNSWNRYHNETIHAIALVYVMCRTQKKSIHSIKSALLWENLFAGAMGLGLPLHGGSDTASPLLNLLHRWPMGHPDERIPPRDMDARLQAWLELLQSNGVDLCAYGHEEHARFCEVRRVCERPWHHGEEGHKCDTDDYKTWNLEPKLFAFSYGAELADWELWLIHPGDQYAGHFWQMVEEGSCESYAHAMPGCWIEAE